MKRDGIEVLLNIAFWGLTGWLITAGFSIESQEIRNVDGVETVKIIRNSSIIKNLLLYIGISSVLFYGNFANILRLEKHQKATNVVQVSLALLVATVATILIVRSPSFWLAPPVPEGVIWGSVLFYFAVSTTYALGKTWIHLDRQRQKLAYEKTQAELTLLRNQLQPHFLFNALNNLLSLVDQQKNPLLASSLDKLSGLLRYIVHETSSEKVPVGKEIEFLVNYAALQKLRFEQNEVLFTLNIKGEYKHQTVEPGIFIPFLENAFKYGAEPECTSEICVMFDLTLPKIIRYSIQNPVLKELQKQHGGGTGIKHAQERLDLVYPGRHSLSIKENDLFMVELEIITQ